MLQVDQIIKETRAPFGSDMSLISSLIHLSNKKYGNRAMYLIKSMTCVWGEEINDINCGLLICFKLELYVNDDYVKKGC